jgi:hypothetical protein
MRLYLGHRSRCDGVDRRRTHVDDEETGFGPAVSIGSR